MITLHDTGCGIVGGLLALWPRLCITAGSEFCILKVLA